MKVTKTLDVDTRQKWRAWLTQNYDSESEIWLVMHKKSSGKRGLLYNDAVEEALCFGWIDSIAKSVDEEKYVQRYTPRKKKGGFSPPNIERLRKLLKQGKVIKEVSDKLPPDLFQEKEFAPDIVKELRKDTVVWKNFRSFSPAYRRIRVGYIEGARDRPEEFKKRLNNFIAKTRDNKQIGFGGIDKLY